jgi:hypothetical protein
VHKTLTAFFDSMEAAERAAESGIPVLTLPVEGISPC